MIFRIDDISVNTNEAVLHQLIGIIRTRLPRAKIMLAISPMVHDMSSEPEREKERAFPRILSAMSDYRRLFYVKRAGIPNLAQYRARLASHGLVHADHRLMVREAQELSIVASCSLVGTSTFVPPFNKWNQDTASICDAHAIELVKFEDGWRHVRFNHFELEHNRYYLHTHDTTPEWLSDWFEGGNLQEDARL